MFRFGAELAAALTTPDDGVATIHPWVERDPAIGARSLKVPLPAPETGKRIADALALLADALLGAGNSAPAQTRIDGVGNRRDSR